MEQKVGLMTSKFEDLDLEYEKDFVPWVIIKDGKHYDTINPSRVDVPRFEFEGSPGGKSIIVHSSRPLREGESLVVNLCFPKKAVPQVIFSNFIVIYRNLEK